MALDANTSQQPLTPETRRGLLRAFARPHAHQGHGHGRSRGHAGHRARRPRRRRHRAPLQPLRPRRGPHPPIRAKLKPTAPATRPTPSSRVSPWPAPCDGARSAARISAAGGTPPKPQATPRPRPWPPRPACPRSRPSLFPLRWPRQRCKPQPLCSLPPRRNRHPGPPPKQRPLPSPCRPSPSGTGRSQASRHALVFPQDHANLRPPGHLCRLYRRHCKLAGRPRLRPHAGRRRIGNAKWQPRSTFRITARQAVCLRGSNLPAVSTGKFP